MRGDFELTVLKWLSATGRRIPKYVFLKDDSGVYKISWVDSAWIGYQLAKGVSPK